MVVHLDPVYVIGQIRPTRKQEKSIPFVAMDTHYERTVRLPDGSTRHVLC